jgi:hypothetical protein
MESPSAALEQRFLRLHAKKERFETNLTLVAARLRTSQRQEDVQNDALARVIEQLDILVEDGANCSAEAKSNVGSVNISKAVSPVASTEGYAMSVTTTSI